MTIQDFINANILTDEKCLWTKPFWIDGEYLVEFSDGTTRGGLRLDSDIPDDIQTIGCTAYDVQSTMRSIVFDIDVAHGKQAAASVDDAISQAKRLRESLGAHLEIRHSKSGKGIHGVLQIPPSWTVTKDTGTNFAKTIAKSLGVTCDPSVSGRQMRYLWSRNRNEKSFQLIESAAPFDSSETVEGFNAYLETAKLLLPAVQHASTSAWSANLDRNALIKRARKYVGKIEPSIEGQGGDAQLLNAARALVKGFALTSVEARPIMVEFNSRCQPPWPEDRLDYKLSEAVAWNGPEGYLLTEEKIESQATQLVNLTAEMVMFHWQDNGYAKVTSGGHVQVYPVKSEQFKKLLGSLYWHRYAKAPPSSSVSDAIGAIESKALYDGNEEPVHYRVAESAGKLYLDLHNSSFEVVEISPAGWKILDSSRVNFVRKTNALPLPTPVHGGDVGELKPFLNLDSDGQWQLFLAFILNCYHDKGPYAHLLISGMQGSSKSTVTRIARMLVDPKGSDVDPRNAILLSPPKDVKDLMIAAQNNCVLPFDNLSHVPDWLSDALCRLATGGSLNTRKLYTDGEEIVFNIMRPAILNGIPHDLTNRSDLMERLVLLELPAISPDRRRTEEAFWREFQIAQPRILGALLSLLSAGLRQLPETTLKSPPRMADFARFSVACLGVQFLEAYKDNQIGIDDIAIHANPVGPYILYLLENQTNWNGNATCLLSMLQSYYATQGNKHGRDLPSTPSQLSRILRRIAPNLKSKGIEYQTTHSGIRQITLTKVALTC
jgi:hypothetical protein